jgi:hypothetical protein
MLATPTRMFDWIVKKQKTGSEVGWSPTLDGRRGSGALDVRPRGVDAA